MTKRDDFKEKMQKDQKSKKAKYIDKGVSLINAADVLKKNRIGKER
jgi:hypothetical protein